MFFLALLMKRHGGGAISDARGQVGHTTLDDDTRQPDTPLKLPGETGRNLRSETHLPHRPDQPTAQCPHVTWGP